MTSYESTAVCTVLPRPDTSPLTHVLLVRKIGLSSTILEVGGTEFATKEEASQYYTFEQLPEPWTLAQRGCGANIAPESTTLGRRLAASIGGLIVDGGDVRFTANRIGIDIDMHDTTLDRTTNLSGNVGDSTLAKIITRWFGILISQPQDLSYNDSRQATKNGYQVVVRVSGAIDVFRKTNGATVGRQQATAAITQGTVVTIKIDYTATGFTVTRVDTGNTLTVNDTTHTGPYFQLG